MQREDYAYAGRPSLNDRPEGVEAGTLKLVGTSEVVIYNEFTRLLDNKEEYIKMAKAVNPYSGGNACKRIYILIEIGNIKLI